MKENIELNWIERWVLRLFERGEIKKATEWYKRHSEILRALISEIEKQEPIPHG